MRRYIRRLLSKIVRPDKYKAEEKFWKEEMNNYVEWYKGNLKEHYQTPSPKEKQKISCQMIEHSAALTWFEIYQKHKYASDLQLPKDAFRDMKVLDVGSGPFPNGEVFEGCWLYCLDPLLPLYVKAGYPPLHYYGENTRFVCGYAEKMPLESDFFDAVISMNSLDHVDDIYVTGKEIERVLKPDGRLRVHVHFHKKTITEPLELSDEVMQQVFCWCEGFKKIHQTNKILGYRLNSGESYNLWSNF